MNLGQFNIFDGIVIGVVALSALLAFFRGFIRELLSLGAWVGAAIITLYLFPHSTEFVKAHMKAGSHNEKFAAGAAAIGTYVLALVAISLVNSVIMRYVKTGSEVGLLDNFLGFFFGMLRGIFIVTLCYVVMQAALPNKENPPVWLKESFTKQYLKQSGDFLVGVAPKYLNELEVFVKKESDEQRQRQEQQVPQPDQAPVTYHDIPATNTQTSPNTNGTR